MTGGGLGWEFDVGKHSEGRNSFKLSSKMLKEALSSQITEYPQAQADHLLLELALDCKREVNLFICLGFHILVKLSMSTLWPSSWNKNESLQGSGGCQGSRPQHIIHGEQEQQDTLWGGWQGVPTCRCHRWFWAIHLCACQNRSTGGGVLNLGQL